MEADYRIMDYYKEFKDYLNKQMKMYKTRINNLVNRKKDYYFKLCNDRELLNKVFHINLYKYKIEFLDKRYNPEEALKKVLAYHLKKPLNNDLAKKALLNAYTYVIICEKIVKYVEEYNKLYEFTGLKMREYERLVVNYYNKVQEIVLMGDFYKFKGIPQTFKLVRGKTYLEKQVLDYDKTNKAKAELLSRGFALNDRNVNGKDYRIYKEANEDYYKFGFINLKHKNEYLIYERNNYVNKSYRAGGEKAIRKLCPTIKSVMFLPVDIKTKLNIILMIKPEHQFNIIDYGRICYQRRENYSENRQ